jgi:hypothetical protein
VAEVELGLCITSLGKRSNLSEGGGVITTLKRCPAIINIRPRRPGAKEKRSDDSECGGHVAHATNIAEPTREAHKRPGQLAV